MCPCLWAENVGALGEKESVELQPWPVRSPWFTRQKIQILCYNPKMEILKTVLVFQCMPFLHWLLAAMRLNVQHNFPLTCFFCAICLCSFPWANQLKPNSVSLERKGWERGSRIQEFYFCWNHTTAKTLAAIIQNIVALGMPASACLLCYVKYLISYCFTLMKEVVLSMIEIFTTSFL